MSLKAQKMNIAEIEIKKKSNGKIQYLTEVLKEIPTNTILCKTLTGLGATYGEIKSKTSLNNYRAKQACNRW